MSVASLLALSAMLFAPVIAQGAGSPQYNYMYQKPLPIPEIAKPIFTVDSNGTTVEYYSVTVESFTQQVYPNLGPAHMIGCVFAHH